MESKIRLEEILIQFRKNIRNALQDFKFPDSIYPRISRTHIAHESLLHFSENLPQPVIEYSKLHNLMSVDEERFRFYKPACDSLLNDVTLIYIAFPENQELQLQVGELLNRFTAMGARNFLDQSVELDKLLLGYARDFSLTLPSFGLTENLVVPVVETLLRRTESLSQIQVSLPDASRHKKYGNSVNAAIDFVLSTIGIEEFEI